MARISYSVEVPKHFNEREAERRINRDLEVISSTFLNIVPQDHRNEINVAYGNNSGVNYKSIGQLNELYKECGRLSLSYNGPTLQDSEKIEDMHGSEIYQALLNGEDGDSYNLSLKNGRRISGVPIFNQCKGKFTILDMCSEISVELSVDQIRDVRKCD
jgi:hypothetical protein|tara:strand:+ start:34 stop:510 length:477 start_codon:yes stop_codon:yes gene_type:complete